MRTFIAIELPPDIRDYLDTLQAKLKATGADVKWVESKNIHLTLKFLGEIDEKKLEKVNRILENLALAQNQFTIRLSRLGAFPGINSPRVLWLGIDSGDAETKRIAATLEEKIAEIGIPKEKRPFSSHITLGRVRSGLNRIKLVEGLKGWESEPAKKNLQFIVTRIALFKSNLTPQGPLYEILKEVNLKTI